jgi:hypothetical protein
VARELSSIISELGNVYDPQRQLVQQQQQALEPALQAEQAGLESAKTDAFQAITEAANRRGMFYSGVPIAEQAKYTGGTFLPAVANLRSKYQQQRFNLQDTLNKIQQEQYSQAYGIRQKELDTEEQQRQFNAQLAAQRSAGGGGGYATPSFGYGGGAGAAGSYRAAPKQGGGFAFTDADGNPISAATYAAATGIPFRNLLQNMANQGDQGAKAALNFVGGDYRYDPNKIGQGNNAAIYNALVWGTNLPQASAPKAAQGRPQFTQAPTPLYKSIPGMR